MGNKGTSFTHFLGSKITADGDCSYEIKKHLLPGRKVISNLDCILKSRDVTLPAKVYIVKAMVFPVVMYGCESWTIKKAVCRRIDALNCGVGGHSWETTRKSNQSILTKSFLNILCKDWCWGLNSNTLDPLCEELTHLKRPRFCERMMAGGEDDDSGWDGWMASPTPWTWTWVNSRRWWWTGKPGMLQSMGLQRIGHEWVTEMNINGMWNTSKWMVIWTFFDIALVWD